MTARGYAPMTLEEVGRLPAVVDLPTAARALGVGRSAAYEMVRTGQWPTPLLRLGRLVRVPTAPLLQLLGVGVQGPGWRA